MLNLPKTHLLRPPKELRQFFNKNSVFNKTRVGKAPPNGTRAPILRDSDLYLKHFDKHVVLPRKHVPEYNEYYKHTQAKIEHCVGG